MGNPTLKRYIQIRKVSGYKLLEKYSLGITDKITDSIQLDLSAICRH